MDGKSFIQGVPNSTLTITISLTIRDRRMVKLAMFYQILLLIQIQREIKAIFDSFDNICRKPIFGLFDFIYLLCN